MENIEKNKAEPVLKKCPNCKRLTAESEYKKFTKTTNGVTRVFWRCPVCESFKNAAKKSLLKNKLSNTS